jgi:hypothetical protein
LKVNLDYNNPVRRYIRGLICCGSLPRLAAYIALLGSVLDEMEDDDSHLLKEIIKLKLSLYWRTTAVPFDLGLSLGWG